MLDPRAKKGALFLAAAAVPALGGAVWHLSRRDRFPTLAEADTRDGQAARVERFNGQVEFRPAAGQQPWSPVGAQSTFRLGTLIRAGAQSSVELMTPGKWFMGLDGEGSVVLQDARRDAEDRRHAMSVYVHKGRFKAKAAGDDYTGYYLEVTTAAARVRVFEGEFGMEVDDQGKGRMWLMGGKAVALWNDGRRKELGLRGLEEL